MTVVIRSGRGNSRQHSHIPAQSSSERVASVRRTQRSISPLAATAAIGGTWVADLKLISEKKWPRITGLTKEVMKLAAAVKPQE